ncbi:hypothetical protein BJX70DRAFT_368333 [Aspergillus crustosus]
MNPSELRKSSESAPRRDSANESSHFIRHWGPDSNNALVGVLCPRWETPSRAETAERSRLDSKRSHMSIITDNRRLACISAALEWIMALCTEYLVLLLLLLNS